MNSETIINPDAMRTAVDQASELMKALSNPHRLLMLCHLVDGEKSVGQLAEFLGIRDSTVSQHLALLRRDGIIAGRRDGQTIWYRGRHRPQASERALRALLLARRLMARGGVADRLLL